MQKLQEAYEAGYVSGVATSLENLVQVVHNQDGLIGKSPGVFQLVIPAELVEETLNELLPFCMEGDIIIDHGNSNFKDSRRRADRLAKLGISYLDCGTSGGVYGWSVDTVLWLAVQILQYPLALQSLGHSHQVSAEPRTDPLSHETSAEHGWLHCGPPGAGHFVKMVHNGIEYGIMQAYAEGFNILHEG